MKGYTKVSLSDKEVEMLECIVDIAFNTKPEVHSVKVRDIYKNRLFKPDVFIDAEFQVLPKYKSIYSEHLYTGFYHPFPLISETVHHYVEMLKLHKAATNGEIFIDGVFAASYLELNRIYNEVMSNEQ